METTTLPIEQCPKVRAEALGFRLIRVQQQSADVYQVFDPSGYLWQIRLCAEWDELPNWQCRSEAEKDALFTLAMDEYYGSPFWEEGEAWESCPV